MLFLESFWEKIQFHIENLDFSKAWTPGEWFVFGMAMLLVIIVIIVVVLIRGSRKKSKIVLESAPKKDAEAHSASTEDKVTPIEDKKTEEAVETVEEELTVEEAQDETVTEEVVEEEPVVEEVAPEIVVEEPVVEEVVEEEPVVEEAVEAVEEELTVEDVQEEAVAEEVAVEEPVVEEDKDDDVQISIEGFDDLVEEVAPEVVAEETVVEEVVEEEPAIEEVVETVEEESAVEDVQEEAVVEEVVETVEEEKVVEATEVTVEAKAVEADTEETVEVKNNRYQGKYEIFREGASFRFRLKASNGEALAISEVYRAEASARKGIDTVKRNIESGKVSITCDKHDLWKFQLISSTGRVLVNSASYKTEKRAQTALASFKRFAFNDNISVVEANEAQFEVEEEAYDDGGEFESSVNGKYLIVEEDGSFSYMLKANNGHIICQSQIYSSRSSCLNALDKFRDTVYTGTFYISHDKNDRYQFKLYMNKPKRVVMAGEIYSTKEAAIKVIKSIKRFAKDAVLKD